MERRRHNASFSIPPRGLADQPPSAPMVRDRRGRCQGRGTWWNEKGDGAWWHPPRLGRRRREASGQGDAAGRTRRGGLGKPVPPLGD